MQERSGLVASSGLLIWTVVVAGPRHVSHGFRTFARQAVLPRAEAPEKATCSVVRCAVAAPDVTGAAGASEQADITQSLIEAGESPECPECGSMSLAMTEGCKTCQSCGWSECS